MRSSVIRKGITAILVFGFLQAKAQDTAAILQQQIKLYPVLFHQTSAEYRALCYQAFNTARQQIDQIRKKRFRREKLAIVTDLDETILDNSYAEADLLQKRSVYTDSSWQRWVSAAAATEVPGSVAFLQYAKDKGAEIFYISNRSLKETAATIVNMQKLKLPDADTAHLLFYSTNSSKEERRQTVEKTHKIIMLLGDNLNDFSLAFEKGDIANRFAETDRVQTEWGKRFFVLPNVIYGEWENALFNYDRKLTPVQKQQAMQRLLKSY